MYGHNYTGINICNQFYLHGVGVCMVIKSLSQSNTSSYLYYDTDIWNKYYTQY